MKSTFFIVLLLSACQPDPTGKDSSIESEVVDEGVVFDIELSTSALIPTVVVVDWQVDQEVQAAWIEFTSEAGASGRATAPIDGPAPYHATVLGLLGSTEYQIRVLVELADGRYASEVHRVTTGSVPATFPNLSVEDLGSDRGGFYVTNLVGHAQGPVIIDSNGNYVWWYMNDAGQGGGGPPVPAVVYSRAALSRDGEAMIYADLNGEGEVENHLFRVALDGSWQDAIETPYLHHDFVELPDAGFVYLSYAPRMIADLEVMGDVIVELDPEGNLREIYNIWDHYTFKADNPLGVARFWPHANSIDYIAEEDSLIVGFDALGTILKIDRQTGETLWTLGGSQSDFTLGGNPQFLGIQHQFDQVEGGLLVFDNGGLEPGGVSRAVEFAFTPGEPAAYERWSYTPEPSLHSAFLGDVSRLGNGNTLVTFSVSGQIHEVDPSGEPVWSLRADIGGSLGFVTWMEDLDLGSW